MSSRNQHEIAYEVGSSSQRPSSIPGGARAQIERTILDGSSSQRYSILNGTRLMNEISVREEGIDYAIIQVEISHIYNESNIELSQTVLEPHNLEEFYMGSLTSADISEDQDRTYMRFTAQERSGVHFGAKYVWDARAENIRLGVHSDPGNPAYQRISNTMPASCGVCGETGHRENTRRLRHFGWELRIRMCKYCVAVLLGFELDGVCCGYKNSESLGINFRCMNCD